MDINFLKKRASLFVIVLMLFSFVYGYSFSFAFNLPLDNGGNTPPANNSGGTTNNGSGILPGEDLTIQDVFTILTGIACWLSRVAGSLMVIFIILAGFRFMNARGDSAKWTSAKKNFAHVLIGSLVILGVYVIIATIANAVGADFSFIPLAC